MAQSSRKGVLETETFRFKWTLKRFYADCEKAGDLYKSPVFPVLYSDEVTFWSLQVFPKGKDEKSESCVSLFLNFHSGGAFEVTAQYKCTIVSEKNSEEFTGQGTHIFKGPADFRGWAKFVKPTVIKDTKNCALIDDTLTILCEITFPPLAKGIADKCYEYNEWQWQITLDERKVTFKELFESGSFCDVTFNIQERKIHSHKAILSCHSPVFKAMFENDMKEKKESSVDITDIDYEIMKELFQFIYSGKVENIEKIAKNLLIAADKYDVAQLKALCEKTLYHSLTADNAIEYLKLTEMCNTIKLKKLVIEYVVENLKDIVQKSDFNLLFADLNREVVCEIVKALAENKN